MIKAVMLLSFYILGFYDNVPSISVSANMHASADWRSGYSDAHFMSVLSMHEAWKELAQRCKI